MVKQEEAAAFFEGQKSAREAAKIIQSRVKMYAELTGDSEKYGIKSLYDNRFVIEGRFVYDCFVLNEKADAIWYQGTAIGG